MIQMRNAQPGEAIAQLVAWGESLENVRALLMTSSSAIPGAPVDLLTDYDVILVARDIRPFHADRSWLTAFGPLLAVYRDPMETYLGYDHSGYVVQYEDGFKLDWTLWPVETLRKIAAAPRLPDELDAGYRVLLDKDGLCQGMLPPTYQAFIPRPPSEAEYQDSIEVFLQDAFYVAKFLWRDDLVAAKHIHESGMIQEHVRPMLEWSIEIDHDWSVKPGPYGRRLKQWVRPDLWRELEGIYVGAGVEENWEALFRTIAFLRKVALEVGEKLGFTYPEELEQRALTYLEKIQSLPPGAERFP